MRILGWLASATAVVVGFACGGNVVVDGTGDDDGSGGTGPTSGSSISTSSSSGGIGGTGASCAAPPPVGVPSFCGGSSTGVGAGGPTECQVTFCDGANNQYTSKCAGSTCVCSFNSTPLCTCAVAGDACSGAVQGCCPFAFAR